MRQAISGAVPASPFNSLFGGLAALPGCCIIPYQSKEIPHNASKPSKPFQAHEQRLVMVHGNSLPTRSRITAFSYCPSNQFHRIATVESSFHKLMTGITMRDFQLTNALFDFQRIVTPVSFAKAVVVLVTRHLLADLTSRGLIPSLPAQQLIHSESFSLIKPGYSASSIYFPS